MNALDQVINTVYNQMHIYLSEHCIGPNDLVIRVTVSPKLRQELLYCATGRHTIAAATENGKETILGQPLEVAKDVQDGVYYLDLIVYNRVQKQLKFTLQGDGGHE